MTYNNTPASTATTGLLSSIVDVHNLFANITCFFAPFAPAVGCHVSFGSLLEVNITRDAGADVARDRVTLPEELSDSTEVTAAEIMAGGSIGPTIVNPTINIVIITTTSECIPICGIVLTLHSLWRGAG